MWWDADILVRLLSWLLGESPRIVGFLASAGTVGPNKALKPPEIQFSSQIRGTGHFRRRTGVAVAEPVPRLKQRTFRRGRVIQVRSHRDSSWPWCSCSEGTASEEAAAKPRREPNRRRKRHVRPQAARRIVVSPLMASTPGRIRTCDLRIRSPLLYPAELRALDRPFGTGDALKSIVSDEFGLAVACRGLSAGLVRPQSSFLRSVGREQGGRLRLFSAGCLVFTPQPITIGLGDRVPPDRSYGPFKATEHAAAGGIVWALIGDAQSGPHAPNSAKLYACGNPHSSQWLSRLGPKIGQFLEWLIWLGLYHSGAPPEPSEEAWVWGLSFQNRRWFSSRCQPSDVAKKSRFPPRDAMAVSTRYNLKVVT
jgi:hypothetical protein